MASNSDSTGRSKCVIPNLMPCEISPCETTITKQLWNPTIPSGIPNGDMKEVTAYFRGRRLVGREIDLPEGFTGVVSENTIQHESTAALERRTGPETHQGFVADGDDDDDNQRTPLPGLERKYIFDKIRILGHEEQPSADTPQMRALQEWTKMAAAIHRRT